MPENGANGPGRTGGGPRKIADRPRKTASPPEKPAKPPPPAGAGRGACNRRAGGPEGPRAAPPEGLPAAPEAARAEPPARGERTGSDRPRPAGPDTGNAPGGGRSKNREKNKNGRREQGLKGGERAGPCAWRYSCQVASVNVRAGPNTPVHSSKGRLGSPGWSPARSAG